MNQPCPQCGKASGPLAPDARGKAVCSDCCAHDYAFGVCKFCRRSWGLSISYAPRKEDPPRF